MVTGDGVARGGDFIDRRTINNQTVRSGTIDVQNPYPFPVYVRVGTFSSTLAPGSWDYFTVPEGEYRVTILDGYGRPLQSYRATAGSEREESRSRRIRYEEEPDE